MPISFTWDINPVALLALAGGAVTVVAFWIRSSDVAARANALAEAAEKEVREARRIADDACRLAKAAMNCAEKAHEKLTYVQAQFAAYRETQAGQLVSREVLREAESRLGAAIDRLGDRLDSLVKELVVSRREPK
jgi:hypothetical protein